LNQIMHPNPEFHWKRFSLLFRLRSKLNLHTNKYIGIDF
jgi:hypothetical protein